MELIGKAIEVNPSNAPSHGNKGLALESLRQWEAALGCYDRAIAIDPNYAEAHCNRGNVLRKLNRHPAALASCDRALFIKPELAEAHFNRGLVLKALRRPEEACASYERAIAIRADYFEAHCNLGNVQELLGQSQAALDSYGRALAIKADLPEAHFNRGVLLHEHGRFEEAVKSYEQAISYRPDYAHAYSNRGNALTELNQMVGAMASYERAIAADPEYAEAHFNHAIALLLVGEFERVFQKYEWRWRNPGGSAINERRTFSQPLWLGADPPTGKTILLYGEQGLGDTIQFCRYAKPLADLGCTVILEVRQPLIGLLAHLEGVSKVVAKGDPLPAYDLQCPLMSLPLSFRTSLDHVPSPGRYLRTDAARVGHWRARLGEPRRPRVGLVWSGSARQRNDHKRSIALSQLIRHLPGGIQYVCLQKDLRELDERTLEANPQVLNFGRELDFDNTAALCECLDLVISVDTSVAHLSGALGKETWILLPFNPDWRWLLNRNDSPWYRSAKLFRQPAIGDWESVLARVAVDLTGLLKPVPQ